MAAIRISRAFALSSLVIALAGMQHARADDAATPGVLERTGKAIDHAAQKTGEAVKPVVEKTGAAIKKAGEKVGEALEKTDKKIQGVVNKDGKYQGKPAQEQLSESH